MKPMIRSCDYTACLLVAACFVFATNPLRADVIFNLPWHSGSGSNIPAAPATFRNAIATHENDGSNLATIFNFNLTQASVGQTFVANAQTEPQFLLLTKSLTDGLDQWLNVGSLGSHQAQYFGNLPGGNGIDLAGYDITSISMQVVSRTVLIPGSDPNHDGRWHDENVDYNISFEGVVVPEPSSMIMAAVGLPLLVALVLRRKRIPCQPEPADRS